MSTLKEASAAFDAAMDKFVGANDANDDRLTLATAREGMESMHALIVGALAGSIGVRNDSAIETALQMALDAKTDISAAFDLLAAVLEDREAADKQDSGLGSGEQTF